MGKLLNEYSAENRKQTLFTVLTAFIGILLLIPLLYMLSASFKTPGEFSGSAGSLIPNSLFFGNYEYVMKHPFFFKIWFLNSVMVVIITIVCRFLVTVTAAYAFARLEFPFKKTLFLLAMAVMMIPTDATLVGRYLVYKSFHITDSSLALILPAMADTLILFMMRQFFMVIPSELTEAGVIDGCSHFLIYYKLILPLAKPALMTMVLFTFIWSWNDFTDPNLFISSQEKQMLTVGLYSLSATDHGTDLTKALAGAVMAIIPTIMLFSFTQKYFVEGIASSGIKG